MMNAILKILTKAGILKEPTQVIKITRFVKEISRISGANPGLASFHVSYPV